MNTTETTELNLNKPIQFIDGTPARIICTDLKDIHGCNIAVAFKFNQSDKEELILRINSKGYIKSGSGGKIQNVPEEYFTYCNIYSNGNQGSHHDKVKDLPNSKVLGIMKYTYKDENCTEIVKVEFTPTEVIK